MKHIGPGAHNFPGLAGRVPRFRKKGYQLILWALGCRVPRCRGQGLGWLLEASLVGESGALSNTPFFCMSTILLRTRECPWTSKPCDRSMYLGYRAADRTSGAGARNLKLRL